MNSLIESAALLQAAPAQAGLGDGSNWMTLVMIGGVFLVFYFLVIRPQSKKQKEAKKMLAALKKGDKVQTIGGLRGTVWQIKEKEDCIIIKTEDDVKLEFIRSAIASVVEQQPAAEEAKDEKASTDSGKK